MTTANPSVTKIRRAMALKKTHPAFIQAVDNEQNARDFETPRRRPVSSPTSSSTWPSGREAASLRGRRPRARPADRHAAEPEAARHAVVRRRRPARQRVCRAQGARAQDDPAERRDLRGDEESRAEHGDFQRRRHRDLQHHASRPGVLRHPGRQLSLQRHAVPRHRQRERPGLRRLRAVTDRADDRAEQPVSGPADDRRRLRRR